MKKNFTLLYAEHYDAIYHYGELYKTFERCINEDGSVDSKKLAYFVDSNGYDGFKYCKKCYF